MMKYKSDKPTPGGLAKYDDPGLPEEPTFRGLPEPWKISISDPRDRPMESLDQPERRRSASVKGKR